MDRKKILYILGSVISILIVVLLLNALKVFHFLPIPQISTKNSQTQTQVQPTIIPKREIPLNPSKFHCPLPNELCKSGQIINLSGTQAIIFNLPPNTPILAITDVINFRRFTPPKSITNDVPAGIFQTAIIDDDCYTITYSYPSDDVISKITAPFSAGTLLATSSGSSLTTEGKKQNLMIQLQSRKDKICALPNQPKDFGTFQPLDLNMFANQEK